MVNSLPLDDGGSCKLLNECLLHPVNWIHSWCSQRFTFGVLDYGVGTAQVVFGCEPTSPSNDNQPLASEMQPVTQQPSQSVGNGGAASAALAGERTSSGGGNGGGSCSGLAGLPAGARAGLLAVVAEFLVLYAPTDEQTVSECVFEEPRSTCNALCVGRSVHGRLHRFRDGCREEGGMLHQPLQFGQLSPCERFGTIPGAAVANTFQSYTFMNLISIPYVEVDWIQPFIRMGFRA